MKKPMSLALVCVAIAVLFLTGCPPNGTPPGGGGADFDSTQYYTKSDINNMMGFAWPRSINSSAIVSAANTAYSNGVTLFDASVPATGTVCAMLTLTYNHTGAPAAGEDMDIGIGESASGAAAYGLKDMHDGEVRTVVIRAPNANTKMWVWGGTIVSGATLTVWVSYVFYDPKTAAGL